MYRSFASQDGFVADSSLIHGAISPEPPSNVSVHVVPYDKSGFTLIELLVVISIISLLLSILLPALKGIRERMMRLKCRANLNNIFIALQTYAHDYPNYYPHCGGYDPPPKPCPENLLLSQKCLKEQKIFFCPKDKPNTWDETENLFGGGGAWARTLFWSPLDTNGAKYVRFMHDFDLREESFCIDWMESSYMWNEEAVSNKTKLNNGHPATLGIVSDGSHVVNRWDWGCLADEQDCRLDQTHLKSGRKEGVNMLYGDGAVEWISLEEVADVCSNPD